MKRTLLSLLVVVTSLAVMGQDDYDMVYVHRNDMDFNIFFRDEIVRISFSNYDADSLFHEQPVSQVVETTDSTYIIPLEVIDSVSFVQPPTYAAGVTELTDDFLDYIVSADSLTLTLSRDIPSALMPKIGDKLAYLHFSDVLPNGFLGTVKTITEGADGYVLSCEGLSIDDAVERYYGVFLTGLMANPYELMEAGAKVQYPEVDERSSIGTMFARTMAKNAGTRKRSPIDVITLSPQTKLVTIENLPLSVDLLEMDLLHDAFEEKDIVEGGITLSGKAALNANISPFEMLVRYSFAKDSFKNLLAIGKISLDAQFLAKGDFDLVGKLSHEVKLPAPAVPEAEIAPGISVYLKPGIEFSGSGEFGIGWDYSGSGTFKADFTIYPGILPTLSLPFTVLPERISARWNDDDFKWKHLLGRANLHAGLFAEVGFGLVTQKIANLSVQCGLGMDVDAEIKIDEDAWRTADKDTHFYDICKDQMKIEFSPVASIGVGVGFLDDRLKYKPTIPFRLPWPHYEGNLLPTFEKSNVFQSKEAFNSAEIRPYFESGFLDFKIGATIHDQAGEYYNTKYYGDDYWSGKYLVFDNLSAGTKYILNPTFELFGKNVLASPETEYQVPEPVAISNFRMTHSSYHSKGYEHEGTMYDYCYYTQMMVTLNDKGNVEDWGYVYEDPHGKRAYISLMGQESPFFETRYAYYRNSSTAAVRLYGYVKYADSDEIKLCTPCDYPLLYEECTLCPDDNHPHMIDLGLPSGTKWACCNIGANVPCGSGGCFSWGETTTKSSYTWENYVYRGNSIYDDCVFLGDDIAGSQYDVASVSWHAPWKMPSIDQFVELSHECTIIWATHYGVNGLEIIGTNGHTIFLPAVCAPANSMPWYGKEIVYWSSSRGERSKYVIDGETIYADTRAQGIWRKGASSSFVFLTAPRHMGLSVRAICE